MNRIILAAVAVLLAVSCVTQRMGESVILCAYSGDPDEWVNETTDPEDRSEAALRQAAQKVHDLLQLRPSFEILMTGVPEAVAQVRMVDGKRFIEFDRGHFRRLLEDEPTRRAAQAIVAHEIGHLLQGHGMDPERKKAQELEADEFSGGVMYRLGASLVEAQRAARMYTKHPAAEGRPAQEERLVAIRRGWRAARALLDRAQRQRDYSAAMMTVARAIDTNDTIRANRTLEHLLPRPGTADVRSFGWFHYWHQLHAEERIIMPRRDGSEPWSMRHIEPIPNTTRVAVGATINGMRGAIFIYDLASEPPKLVEQWPAASGLFGVAPDGSWIAFDEDRSLGDGPAYGLTLRWLNNDASERFNDVHSTLIESFAISPDGRHVATGDGDGMVRLWKVGTRQSLRSNLHRDGEVTSVAFSADGHTLVSGGRDRRLVMSSVHDLSRIREFDPDLGDIEVIAVAPAGRRFAVGGGRGVVLFEAIEQLSSIRRISPEEAAALRFSPDGNLLAIGGLRGVATIYDVGEQEPIRIMRGHVEFVHALAFSTDGQLLLTGDHGSGNAIGGPPPVDGSVRIFRWKASGTIVRYPLLSSEERSRVAISPDGTLFATAESRGIRVWRPNGESKNHLAGELVGAIVFSPDATLVAASSCQQSGTEEAPQISNCRTDVWPTDSDAGPLRLDGHEYPVRALALGRTVIATASCDQIRTWRLSAQGLQGEPLADIPILDRCPYGAFAIALTPDETRVAAVALGYREIVIWDAVNGTRVSSFELADERGASVIALSPDGKWLATGNADSDVTLWTLERDQAPMTLSGYDSDVPDALAFSPDGSLLAAAAGSRQPILLWETSMGLRVGELTAPDGIVGGLIFPRADALVAAEDLRPAKIVWKAAEGATVLDNLRQRWQWTKRSRERELFVAGLWASSLDTALPVSRRRALLAEALQVLDDAPEEKRNAEEVVGWREELQYALRDLEGER